MGGILLEHKSTIVCACVLLAGCGGSNTVDPDAPIPFETRGLQPTIGAPEITETGQAAFRTIISPIAGIPSRQVFANDNYNVPGFDVFYRGVADEQTILLEVSGDDSEAFVSAANASIEGNSAFLGVAATSDGGTMPVIGTAQYDGFYGGVLTVLSGSLLSESFISGAVEINVDFANATASGAITARQRYLTASGADATSDFADISLGQVSLLPGQSDGPGFTGGGRLEQANAVPADPSGVLEGEWSILFAGDNAEEAVGTVIISHNYIQENGGISNDFREHGVFLADR